MDDELHSVGGREAHSRVVVPRATPRHRFSSPSLRPTQVTEEVWRRRESWEQLSQEDGGDSSEEGYDSAASWERSVHHPSPLRGLPAEPPRSCSCDVCRREPWWVAVFVMLVALALGSAYFAVLSVPLRAAQRASEDSLATQLRVAELSAAHLNDTQQAERASLNERLAAAEQAVAQSADKVTALQEEVHRLRAQGEELRLANRSAMDALVTAERALGQQEDSCVARLEAVNAAMDASREETAVAVTALQHVAAQSADKATALQEEVDRLRSQGEELRLANRSAVDALAIALRQQEDSFEARLQVVNLEFGELLRQQTANVSSLTTELMECGARSQVRQVTAESLSLQVESLQEHIGYVELEERLAVGALRGCRERLLESERDCTALATRLERSTQPVQDQHEGTKRVQTSDIIVDTQLRDKLQSCRDESHQQQVDLAACHESLQAANALAAAVESRVAVATADATAACPKVTLGAAVRLLVAGAPAALPQPLSVLPRLVLACCVAALSCAAGLLVQWLRTPQTGVGDPHVAVNGSAAVDGSVYAQTPRLTATGSSSLNLSDGRSPKASVRPNNAPATAHLSPERTQLPYEVAASDRRRLQECFRRADRNGDGAVSRAELILQLRSDAQLSHLLHLPQHVGDSERVAFERIFQGMDKNDDRQISEQEFLGYFPVDLPPCGGHATAAAGRESYHTYVGQELESELRSQSRLSQLEEQDISLEMMHEVELALAQEMVMQQRGDREGPAVSDTEEAASLLAVQIAERQIKQRQAEVHAATIAARRNRPKSPASRQAEDQLNRLMQQQNRRKAQIHLRHRGITPDHQLLAPGR